MVYLNHPLNPSIPSPLPGSCVPATSGTHAELLVKCYDNILAYQPTNNGVFYSNVSGRKKYQMYLYKIIILSYASEVKTSYYGGTYYSNQDKILWRVKIGVYMGFCVHGGS